MNFFEPTADLTIEHTGKGKYTCSNGVTIEFWNISDCKYCKVVHKSGLNILYFDNPIKNQRSVLEPVKNFLSKYNFSLSPDEVKEQIADNPLYHQLQDDRTKVFREVYA